jgi:hypothetical protein
MARLPHLIDTKTVYSSKHPSLSAGPTPTCFTMEIDHF